MRKTDEGYNSFDIKDLSLKYGQERKLLEAVRPIVDDLDLLVRNASFDWNSFFQIHEKDVCKFWKIPKIDPMGMVWFKDVLARRPKPTNTSPGRVTLLT